MDTKLALFAALLAVTDAFVPLSFGYASLEYSSVPSTPVLLLLAAFLFAIASVTVVRFLGLGDTQKQAAS